jgi:replicative DNA helicase
MLGESENQFSLTRAALNTRGAQKQIQLAQLSQGLRWPALVIVDYLQIVESRAASTEKRYAQVGAVSRAMKLFAMQFRLPVIALAQLSRELDWVEREPVLADLRESGLIEQDADVVIFLHPTEQRKGYKPTPTKCIIAKNRNGPLGSALLVFHQTQGRFYEAAQEHAS